MACGSIFYLVMAMVMAMGTMEELWELHLHDYDYGYLFGELLFATSYVWFGCAS